MARFIYFGLIFLFICSIPKFTTTSILSTQSRWIVDEKGQRVKLACVNWPAHLEPVVAEGLSKQPLDSISKKIVSLGFNCVRLTWPLDLMTNDTLALRVTVKQSFERLKLFQHIVGIQTHNPNILHLPLFNAFQEVVKNLGENRVMVILDNHLTTPGWCCSNNDSDAFFGYPNFDPLVWIKGLTKMATLFRNTTNVVAMSLRNEPRGTRDYPNVWLKYMPQGAEAVHSANPRLLVIVSGIEFDTDLSFLRDSSFNVSFTRKLVFELHWYSFSDGVDSWRENNSNDFCASIVEKVRNNGGFLMERGFPLFLSEFGTDQRGVDVSGNRYMNCLMAWAKENDLDWAVWTLNGDYYLRSRQTDSAESYGVLDTNWIDIRNSTYFQKLTGIQLPFKDPPLVLNSCSRILNAGPGLRSNNSLLFHPSTGLCVTTILSDNIPTLGLGACSKSNPWSFNPKEGILCINEIMCVEAPNIVGQKVELGIGSNCSKLEQISATKMHWSFETSDNLLLCLDVDQSDNSVVANICKCLTKDSSCDPASQWFKLL